MVYFDAQFVVTARRQNISNINVDKFSVVCLAEFKADLFGSSLGVASVPVKLNIIIQFIVVVLFLFK